MYIFPHNCIYVESVCIVLDVWFLVSLLAFQSSEIGPDMIISVFLFDKLLI